MPIDKELAVKVEGYSEDFKKVKEQIAKSVIGQERVVRSLINSLIANGHVLLEGVPGIAKTLMIRTLSAIMRCSFSRVQFTPDLLPTDIVGITAFEKDKGFYVVKGPIFANFLLADEINRAPPKVQSALLECMQERQATIGKEVFVLEPPFFVLATQNPLESLGTYPLPEAQIDRFLFKLEVGYPNIEEEERVLTTNITTRKFEDIQFEPVLDGKKLIQIQQDVKKIYLDKRVEHYIVRLVDATRNPSKYKISLGKYVEWGASPRGSIGMYIAAKAEALSKGKLFATPDEVKAVAPDVLRHRILVNYEGQAEGVRAEDIVKEILARVPVP
jgi:MoxR-like ATPase